ncbi:MAG: DUF1592 domain-containing protein [Verrucomicrobiota bacterium]
MIPRGSRFALWALALLSPAPGIAFPDSAPGTPPQIASFVTAHCVECHDAEVHKGGLDLTALPLAPQSSTNAARWVTVLDRVSAGEMPPAKKERPPAADLNAFTRSLTSVLLEADLAAISREGRSTRRRLNRYEYENAVRDLLQAPWLQIRDSLPEDGVAHRFNKVGTALDVSHVQVARYLAAAEGALRQVLAGQTNPPSPAPRKFYARDQQSYTAPMKFSVFNMAPERATFPVLGYEGQPGVRSGELPITVGITNPAVRELEGMGVAAGSYEPLEPKFNRFRAPASGRYRLRFAGNTVWVGPGPTNRWYIPDLDHVERGHRSEPVTVYSEMPPHQLRRLGVFDLTPDFEVHELEAWLLAGETVRVDPARLFRSRPGAGRFQNPLAETNGQPGAVFRWLEVAGPFHESWPPPGHRLLFGDLPLRPVAHGSGVEVVSTNPAVDAPRLLASFLAAAYRRPEVTDELPRFLPVIERALASGSSFQDAMIAGYTAVLCSPGFVSIEETPGNLSDLALSTRLSLFLWNSTPDVALREAAVSGRLRTDAGLRAEAERLLRDPRSRRFVEAFLDYWLDLRRIDGTAPDATLYSDYYLDDLLTESALDETRAYFSELIHDNLPARSLVASDFVMVNERLAQHYGLPPFEGINIRRVSLPPDSPRGGLMTQASVLKVTANGTTTSPVLRGAWILDRILGQPVPPPPPNVPAVDPDIRGAVTIRQQLEKHRDQASCAACHARMDPPGFALESFDVMGGWRHRYRAQGGETPEPGIGKGGQKFEFHYGLPVDSAGELPDGRSFRDIAELKRLLLVDQRPIARNLLRQLTVYATGAPVRFSDRPEIEAILDRTRPTDYGVRSLILELVQSRLFRQK